MQIAPINREAFLRRQPAGCWNLHSSSGLPSLLGSWTGHLGIVPCPNSNVVKGLRR